MAGGGGAAGATTGGGGLCTCGGLIPCGGGGLSTRVGGGGEAKDCVQSSGTAHQNIELCMTYIRSSKLATWDSRHLNSHHVPRR